MNNSLDLTQISKEDLEDWFLHFLEIFKQSEGTDPISGNFLTYYLHPIAKSVAKQISLEFQLSPNPRLHYSEEDVSAIALKLAQPALVLKNFPLDSDLAVKDYAQTMLISLVKNYIVKELNSLEIPRNSDIEVLLNTNIAKLRKALEGYGFSHSETVDRYCLAWLAFRELSERFFPRTSVGVFSEIRPLNQEQLEQITQKYNQMLWRLEPPNFYPVNAKQVETMLSICVQATIESRVEREPN